MLRLSQINLLIYLSGNITFFQMDVFLIQSAEPSGVSQFSLQCVTLVEKKIPARVCVFSHKLWLKAEISADVNSGGKRLRRREKGDGARQSEIT